MQDSNTTSKFVMIDSDSYWHAKDSWGESSLKFDQSCGIKFSKENISWRELRYLPFFIIDEKKFNYAYIKYDFILKI